MKDPDYEDSSIIRFEARTVDIDYLSKLYDLVDEVIMENSFIKMTTSKLFLAATCSDYITFYQIYFCITFYNR